MKFVNVYFISHYLTIGFYFCVSFLLTCLFTRCSEYWLLCVCICCYCVYYFMLDFLIVCSYMFSSSLALQNVFSLLISCWSSFFPLLKLCFFGGFFIGCHHMSMIVENNPIVPFFNANLEQCPPSSKGEK